MADSIRSLLMLLFFADMAIMLTVGGRLLYAAARSGRTPEAAIGTSAAFGALGVILSLLATTVFERDPALFPLWAAGRIVQTIGACGLAVGCWRIYRCDEARAAMVSAMACAVAVTGCAIRVIPGSIPPPGDGSLGVLISGLAGMIVYSWASGEALRYHLQLRRRMTLGLADPLVTHRFWLWALSGSCALAGTATGTFFAVVLGGSVSDSAPVFIGVQLVLFAAAVGLWFAFFPPAFYRRGVLARAANASS